jgi:signal peptidase I
LNEDVELTMKEKSGFSVMREMYDWVESALSALLCVVILFIFAGVVISVDGISMVPTLKDGERLVCVKFFEPEYGDIVVVTKPGMRNNPLIKRVIATEGQTLDFDFENGFVYVDGELLDEPYTNTPTNWHVEGVEYPMTIPEGHVFVMGDNRNSSWDSRVPEVGAVDRRYVMGRVVYSVMPYDRIGRVK